MGSNHSQPVDVDPQALDNARSMWGNFTCAIKYGIIANVILLLLMAFFLV